MEQVEASIARYLAALDRTDREEGDIAEEGEPDQGEDRRPSTPDARSRSSMPPPTDLVDRPRYAFNGDRTWRIAAVLHQLERKRCAAIAR